MPESADVIIVGLGAMGSAAAAHLARRGCRVIGLDRFTPPHAMGSSHGQTRVIREAYFEDPIYVPMIQRAYDLWEELEEAQGVRLYLPTGGLMVGVPDGVLVSGARRSAEQHHLQHEILDPSTLRQRMPAFHVPEEMVGVWEPRAGILFPEKCIEAHLSQAVAAGAHLHYEEPIDHWEADPHGVSVTTSRGRYTAAQLILAAGSWLPSLWPEGSAHLKVERQVLHWFQPVQPDHFHPDRCPVYMIEHEINRYFYGFPDLGEGAKVAIHYQGEPTHPDTVRREVDLEEIEAMADLAAPFLPGLGRDCRESTVCLYTNTKDGHFLIDHHPDHAHVWLASPCSGHGFKFSPLIGELLADKAMGREPRFDLDRFRVNRL